MLQKGKSHVFHWPHCPLKKQKTHTIIENTSTKKEDLGAHKMLASYFLFSKNIRNNNSEYSADMLLLGGILHSI